MIVTIDGPAGAGKSTVARRVAAALGLPFLSSGAIYRAVTLLVLEDGGDFGNASRVAEIIASMPLRFDDGGDAARPEAARVHIGDRDVTDAIRAPGVTSEVWRIASVGAYRDLLVERQRRFAEPRGVVTEGRDMGSVIFPHAGLKIYLDASAEERARRRHKEIVEAGEAADPISYDAVLRAILERDEKDRQRDQAPLRVPDGAQVICSDNLSVDGVVARILELARDAAEPR